MNPNNKRVAYKNRSSSVRPWAQGPEDKGRGRGGGALKEAYTHWLRKERHPPNGGTDWIYR